MSAPRGEAAFVPVLIKIVRSASPEHRAELAQSINEPFGNGDDFAMLFAKKLANPHYAPVLFDILSRVSDACG